MKLFIAFCVTVAVHFAPAEAGFGESVITQLKKYVAQVSVDLEKFNSGLEMDMTKKMDGFSEELSIPMNAALNFTMDDMIERIEAARAEGKGVNHCITTVGFEAGNTTQKMELGLERCIKVSVRGLEKYQKPITAHIKNGISVEAKLDQFVIDCKKEEEGSPVVENCLKEILFQATIIAGKYHVTALQLMGSAKFYIASSYSDVSKCFQEPSKTFLTSLDSDRNNFIQCIDNA